VSTIATSPVAAEAETLPIENELQNDNRDINMHADSSTAIPSNEGSTELVSFKDTIHKLGATEAQEDVSLAFYFICVLHLANEKGLKL